LIGMDGVMTPVALPAIAADLGVGLAVQQWVVAASMLTLGSLLLVGGALGDSYNRWLVLGAGTLGFGIAAAVSALAPNAGVLITGRFLQGAAAAVMVPGALAIVMAAFDGAARSRAIGIWTAWTSLSVIAGPAIAGMLVDAISWRATFGALVPLSVAVVFLIFRAAPGVTAEAEGNSVDVRGAVLAVPAVGGPVFALIQGPQMGWGHPLVVGAWALAGAAAIAFVRVERRAANPLVPFAMFRSRVFAVLNLVTLVLYAALICGGVYLVLFLQQTAGYGPAAAGLASVVPMIVLFLFAKRAGALADRYGPRLFVAGGALISGAGILLLLRTDAEADFLTVVLPSVVVHGVGLALVVSPLTAGVLGATEAGHAGTASGINNAVARVGSLLGVAVVGLVISFQFVASVDDAVSSPGPVRSALEDAKARPLTTTTQAEIAGSEKQAVEEALTAASVDAFHSGVVVLGGLALLASLLAAVGMGDHRHRFRAARSQGGCLVGAHEDLASDGSPDF
jgi:predicted MFS family arabinose efflux permease